MKQAIKSDTLHVNLNEKGDYRAQFADWKEKKGYPVTDENKKLGLKKGDNIEFWGGYHNDIRFTSEILGFDENGKAYINWDCYWFAIDLTEQGNRDFKKFQE